MTMKQTIYESMLLGSNVRAIAYMDVLPSVEWIQKRMQVIENSYPVIKYKVENGEITRKGEYEIHNAKDDGNSIEEFVSNCLTNMTPKSNFEIFLVQHGNSKSGAIMASCNHAFTDGRHMLNFMADFLSEQTEFPVIPHPNIPELIKDVVRSQQTLDFSKQISVPNNPSPKNIPPKYAAKCTSFDIQNVLKVCKSLGIKLQAFFSVSDIYAIAKTLKAKDPFEIGNQVSANVNSYLGIPENSPILASSLIYTLSKIDRSTKAGALMKEIQTKIDNNMSKNVLNHFACLTDGKFNVLNPLSLISNVGMRKTPYNIRVHGGMFEVPAVMSNLRRFTSHVVTTNNIGHITQTYLVPGCEDEFINTLNSHLMDMLNNPEDAIERSIL
ncbi:hypothetical protein TVAG_306080 [Trichomonas vaginalis G3]|uniref:Uncharacterized protein n=1 Tax=Trichomonas vaginalis (strain ATCC PRA-98 / G3) TaxID=412133 RepID=A2DNA0_TRIV3|nr:hypothetical protein TVAGG3_1024220 [Trichomonas vaginalis G3]EAY18088.1 hypothetical protein TVAG_306080 [Trichomonas vaginalis G3]KAI5492365.1 hypothetical protein TVAGG3_1024220 [Trichomonas vaginalis G3]|eukprot:XP_001579074.1 hypothetical protein [Trichomonas vaginalis G3]